MSCQVQETDKVSSSQQAHKYLQTDHICFQERKMFLLFAGSPSLGEFLFLNLDIANMEKIRAIHEQITSNLQVRVTIEELSKQYDMPATSMKKCFREIYGDSIYSYQKR